MKAFFVDYLRDPLSQEPLSLEAKQGRDGEIIEGSLESSKYTYPIINGIPRFVRIDSHTSNVLQTAQSFSNKWKYEAIRSIGYKKTEFNALKEQILATLGVNNLNELEDLLSNGKKILNAGCGVGWTEDLFNFDSSSLYSAVDISLAVEVAYDRNKEKDNVFIAQADLFKLPFPDEFFDIIYSIGVLHHTPNPELAFDSLCKKLKQGGRIGIYTYNVKPFLREMADKTVREITTNMPFEECLNFSKQMALLGKAFQKIDQPLIIEEDIHLLNIKKGKYQLQKFIYDHFLKCYYNKELGMEWSAITNLDWYHPKYASHHTKEEILEWFIKNGVKDVVIRQPEGWEYSGYFMSGVKC